MIFLYSCPSALLPSAPSATSTPPKGFRLKTNSSTSRSSLALSPHKEARAEGGRCALVFASGVRTRVCAPALCSVANEQVDRCGVDFCLSSVHITDQQQCTTLFFVLQPPKAARGGCRLKLFRNPRFFRWNAKLKIDPKKEVYNCRCHSQPLTTHCTAHRARPDANARVASFWKRRHVVTKTSTHRRE